MKCVKFSFLNKQENSRSCVLRVKSKQKIFTQIAILKINIYYGCWTVETEKVYILYKRQNMSHHLQCQT